MFKTTALYVKKHNVTGFKYFGKTTRLQNIHYGIFGYKYKYKDQEKFAPPHKGWSFKAKVI